MSVFFSRALAIALSIFMCSSVLAAKPKTEKPPAPLQIPSDESLGFFVGSRNDTLNNIKRLGILPIVLPAQFEKRDDVKTALLELVRSNLTNGGYEIVAPNNYTPIYDRLNKQLGGIYNTDTGEYKQEQGDALVSAARREFIEKEHLNGLILISVRSAEANFFHSDAYWHGVKEHSTGRMPPSALSDFLWGSDNSRGTLAGYSVLIQLINPQDKVVYGRFGGIQLGVYFDPGQSKSTSNFLFVPADDLLRDQARLERATRRAIQPLVMTPEQIAAGAKDPKINPQLITTEDLPLPPAGIARQAESPLRVPREQILGNYQKVVLAPINIGKFSMSAETQARYLELIRTELKPLNWEIIESPNAVETLRADFKNTTGLFDPFTGRIDEDRLKALRKKTLASLGLDANTAILWPSLTRTRAPHKNGDARWDGASQNALDLGPVKKKSIFDTPVNAGEGSVAAVSLVVQLRNAQDESLYYSQGGIQLIEQLKGDQSVELAPAELFLDPSREQRAVHVALRNLVLSAEDLDKELHPSATAQKAKKTKKSKNDD